MGIRRPLVAGNWKMNGDFSDISDLVNGMVSALSQDLLAAIDWAVFPPFVYLPLVDALLDGGSLLIGAQNVSSHEQGAYTGEVSAAMLTDMGCDYVLIGHSERRSLFFEDHQSVAKKVNVSLNHGLTPIICVGETAEQRASGTTLLVIKEQLAVALSLHDNLSALSRIVVAYEPVWAIGTGKTATPEQAEEVHAAIRSQLAEMDVDLALKVRILYGGSVTPENAADLFAQDNIDGALVGGASLSVDKFLAIGKQCNSFF